MRGFLAVFEREIVERRLILLVGLAGLVPIALPFLPGLSRAGGANLRPNAAVVTAFLASGVLAVLLGATAIGSDLSQNRLGFYFARPLSGWAIWAGKLGAAFVLTLATALLIALPSLAIDGVRYWGLANLPAWLYALWAALVLTAVLAAHAVSVMLRVRSAVLVLDLAAFAVTSVLAISALGRLNVGVTPITLDIASGGFDALALVALGVAGAAQVVAGRSDAHRGRRALSLALWGPLLAGAMALHAYAYWVLSATPADLEDVWDVGQAPAGSWAELTGRVAHRPGYLPNFLVDLRSGRYLRLPQRPELRFSADGRRAAWLGDGAEVVTADLTAPRPAPVRGRLGFGGRLRDLALSPDGARVAAFSPGRLLAADMASGRLLAAAPLDAPGGLAHGLVWSDPSHVRVYRWATFEPDSREIEILELDLATGKLQRTGSFHAPVDPRFTLAPDLRRLAFRGEVAGRWADWVLDARTGAPRFGIVPEEGSSFIFLLGDRCAELERDDPQGSVGAFDVHDLGGRWSRRVAFDGASRGRLGGQPDADHLVYARRDDGHTWTSYLLDLSTGGERLVGRDLLPLRGGKESLPPPDLFWRRGKLVRADLATGAVRKLLGAPALNP